MARIELKELKIKNLTKRTTSDEVINDKAFDIASNLKYDRYQRGLVSMFYKFFIKSNRSAVTTGMDVKKKKLLRVLIQINLIKNQLMNYTNESMQSLQNVKYIHHL